MEKHYVYRFININNQIIYVGETNNINRRINDHLSCNPKRTKFTKAALSKVSRIEYLTVNGTEYGKMLEKYYILQYRSPVLRNIAIPSKKIKIKNPPDNWRIYTTLRASTKYKHSIKAKFVRLVLNMLFWYSIYYLFFK